MRRKWMFIVPAAIVGIVLFTFIGGQVVHLLWNWLLPPLFGWREITFWQALALLALCRILFGGLGRHGWGGTRGRMRGRMADRMAEHWGAMTPEERERFRERVRDRFGFGPAAGESKGQ
jgi:hypothetical protein